MRLFQTNGRREPAGGSGSSGAGLLYRLSTRDAGPPESKEATPRPPAKPPQERRAGPRNPFGFPDVPEPVGKDIQEFASRVKLSGDDKDDNAEQWVIQATKGKADTLDGEWYGRWNFSGGRNWVNGIGVTKVQCVGERVYILFRDHQGLFLIETLRQKNRLVGRWKGIDNPADTGPCVFVIVDGERIDGDWAGRGRWDFRRKLNK